MDSKSLSWADDANLVNHTLDKFYSNKIAAWRALRAEQAKEGHCLSIPIFLRVSPAYLSARPRIVFVGQETHGWWTDYRGDLNAITAGQIMDFYETIWVELYEKYKRSPYWQAMRHISEAFGLNDPPRSFLYSNIFPCDLDEKRAPDALLETFREWSILPNEVRMLAPDYIIFFCGPDYCYNLNRYFDESPKEHLSPTIPLIQYRPSGHTWKGFVTYHPAFLRRSRRWSLLDDIINFIKADLARKV